MSSSVGVHDEAWHARRRESIGASEAHDVVLGRLHKLFLRKTGRDQPGPDTPDSIFGKLMEGAVLDRYFQLHPAEHERQWHGKMDGHPRASATPDAVVRERGRAVRVVEVKCPRYSRGWGPEGSRTVPPRVFWQIQLQMAVTGAPVADVVALLHREVRIYRDIPANREAQALLVAEIEHFWERYVVPDVAPPVDDSGECATYLASLYPAADPERTVQPVDDAEVAAAAREYARAKRAAEDAEAVKRRAKAVLVGRIGSSYGIEGAWGSACHVNVSGRRSVDYAAACRDLIRVSEHNAHGTISNSHERMVSRMSDIETSYITTTAGYRRLDVKLSEGE